MDDLSDKVNEDDDSIRWEPPVNAESFETYGFQAQPYGCFPNWNLSELEPDEREARTGN